MMIPDLSETETASGRAGFRDHVILLTVLLRDERDDHRDLSLYYSGTKPPPFSSLSSADIIMSRSHNTATLPLVPLPYPVVLLPGARTTLPLPRRQADALIRHLGSLSLADPVLAAVPLVQHEGTTSLNRWGVTARIARFVRPRAHSDEPFLLTLTGVARVRLADSSPLLPFPPHNATGTGTAHLPPDSDGLRLPPRVDVDHPPPDSHVPPAHDVVQDFKAAAVRLLERFAQDAALSVRKRESWARIAQLVEETELEKAAALADAIVAAVGADHAEKLGESMN
jgi:ATP-dependent Lon protease